MISIRTLINTDLPAICKAFNEAFAGYFLPISLTPEQLAEKMRLEQIDLHYSVGAFENEVLIAFILHGIAETDGRKLLYNAGTGVLPAARGQQLTRRLYNYIMPQILEAQIDHVQLEVIDQNAAAIHNYEGIGFETMRRLHCFRGKPVIDRGNKEIVISAIDNADWKRICAFRDFAPSWQNSILVVNTLKEDCLLLGAYEKDVLVGYLAFNKKSNRLLQLAVAKEYRRRGIGSELCRQLNIDAEQQLFVTNVDDSPADALHFLQHIVLEEFICQYEMQLSLTKTTNPS